MIGLEMEFMLLDNKGKVVNRADEIISEVKKKEPTTNIVKECGKNMVELGCYPSVKIFNTALDILKHAETLYDVTTKKRCNYIVLELTQVNLILKCVTI